MAEFGEVLSDRELEILQLVATGATNREVASQLDIRPNTVKVHLRNIYTKLGAASRTEATMIAVRSGWVAIPEVEGQPEAVPEPEPEPDPPLPWSRRAVLIVAALLAVAGTVLSWPRRAPAGEVPVGLLPAGGAGLEGQLVGTDDASNWREHAQMPTRRALVCQSARMGRRRRSVLASHSFMAWTAQ